MSAWQQAIGVIAVSGTALFAVGKLLARLWEGLDSLVSAVHVLVGRGEEQPGLLDRLKRIETELRPGTGPSLHERLELIEHELHPNSSLSLRDAVDRIERTATEAHKEAARVRRTFESASRESRRQREQDREVIERMAARLDALKHAKEQTIPEEPGG